jgi:hypothetical protein
LAVDGNITSLFSGCLTCRLTEVLLQDPRFLGAL